MVCHIKRILVYIFGYTIIIIISSMPFFFGAVIGIILALLGGLD